IGISVYASEQVRRSGVCGEDARRLAEVMKQSCGLDEAILLLNAKATRQNIEKALREELTAKTQAGDTVVIYWSGHGGRCEGRDGSEYNEFLVPYDADLSAPAAPRASTVLDDLFLRWLQDLDGRRLIVIIDACRSGGLARSGRDLAVVAPQAGRPFFSRVADG